MWSVLWKKVILVQSIVRKNDLGEAWEVGSAMSEKKEMAGRRIENIAAGQRKYKPESDVYSNKERSQPDWSLEKREGQVVVGEKWYQMNCSVEKHLLDTTHKSVAKVQENQKVELCNSKEPPQIAVSGTKEGAVTRAEGKRSSVDTDKDSRWPNVTQAVLVNKEAPTIDVHLVLIRALTPT